MFPLPQPIRHTIAPLIGAISGHFGAGFMQNPSKRGATLSFPKNNSAGFSRMRLLRRSELFLMEGISDGEVKLSASQTSRLFKVSGAHIRIMPVNPKVHAVSRY
jgi:hypothetical protein